MIKNKHRSKDSSGAKQSAKPSDGADRAIADAIDGAMTPGLHPAAGAHYAVSAKRLAERAHDASAAGACNWRLLLVSREAAGRADALGAPIPDLKTARAAIGDAEIALNNCLSGRPVSNRSSR